MFQEGFPLYLRNDVTMVVNYIEKASSRLISIGITEHHIQYSVHGDFIKFPDRMYYNDIPELDYQDMSLEQKMILHCIFSRNCDGYVRQKHLRLLLLMDYEDWVIPYIVKLCDEYVVEILDMTYSILCNKDNGRVMQFCYENVESFCKSYARMISYWNEFYRDRCYNFHEYIGRRLFRECFGYTRSLERLNKRLSSS